MICVVLADGQGAASASAWCGPQREWSVSTAIVLSPLAFSGCNRGAEDPATSEHGILVNSSQSGFPM